MVSGTLLSYNCDSGYCITAYGRIIYGSSDDVALACLQDYPKCKSYTYTKKGGHGYLCSPENNSRHIFQDYIHCAQIFGNSYVLLYSLLPINYE